jgi:hypothetical protein
MYNYDSRFDPPAPLLPIQVSSPASSALTLSAFVDSGSDTTVIPRSIVQNLRLRRLRYTGVQGFGSGVERSPVFSLLISVQTQEPEIIEVIAWDEDYALLGRDVINHWQVLLNGPGLVLTVSR